MWNSNRKYFEPENCSDSTIFVIEIPCFKADMDSRQAMEKSKCSQTFDSFRNFFRLYSEKSNIHGCSYFSIKHLLIIER